VAKHRRLGDDPEREPDPLTRNEVSAVLTVARERFREWYPFVLCAVRTGMRLSELFELQWSDINWRGSFVNVRRALVRGLVTRKALNRVLDAAELDRRGPHSWNQLDGWLRQVDGLRLAS
jgi:integrase